MVNISACVKVISLLLKMGCKGLVRTLLHITHLMKFLPVPLKDAQKTFAGKSFFWYSTLFIALMRGFVLMHVTK